MQQGIKKPQWFEYLKVVFLEILAKSAIISGFCKSDHKLLNQISDSEHHSTIHCDDEMIDRVTKHDRLAYGWGSCVLIRL